MTSKEAFNDLNKRNEALKIEEHFHIGEKVMNIMKELVERDTPMKPLIDKLDLWDERRCPICKSVVWESAVWEVHSHKDENFCNKCGQRLDWS